MSSVGIEVLGVVAVGIGAAALLFALFHALRRAGVKLAPWLLPLGIGLSMVGYSVWNDYAWFDRAKGRLPESAEILMTGAEKVPWAPWTYLFPITTRFAALDPASITAGESDTQSAQITLVERRGPTMMVAQDFDCSAGLIRPARSEWVPAAGDDPAFAFICGRGR